MITPMFQNNANYDISRGRREDSRETNNSALVNHISETSKTKTPHLSDVMVVEDQRPSIVDDELSPKSAFEHLVGFLSQIDKISTPHWYQILLHGDTEPKSYPGIGTFHELLGIHQDQAMDILHASGLIRNNIMGLVQQIKRNVFQDLKRRIHSFDFALHKGSRKFIYFHIGSAGKRAVSLKNQLIMQTPKPVINSSLFPAVKVQVSDYYFSMDFVGQLLKKIDGENHCEAFGWKARSRHSPVVVKQERSREGASKRAADFAELQASPKRVRGLFGKGGDKRPQVESRSILSDICNAVSV